MGRKKKKTGDAVNLDSFLDILSCLVGVLILIIILTSIDASQTKILIPTPMAQKTDKKMLFIECRSNQLFRIDVDAMMTQVNEQFDELDKTLEGTPEEMMQIIKEKRLESGEYIVDPSYALIGQLMVTLKPGAVGETLQHVNMEAIGNMTIPGWYGDLLRASNEDSDILTFLVRDDSFQIFKKARAIAWTQNIQASYELLSTGDPIIFGLGGDISLAQ